MIHSCKLFTHSECEDIIIQVKNDINNKEVIWDIIAKKYNGWYFEYSNVNNRWVFDKLFDWLKQETGEEVDTTKLISNPMESPMFIHQYSTGDFFIRHKDKVANNTFYRIYNFGIQLSEDYQGGELIVWDKDENEYIAPKEIGTALFYDSELAHEVKPILSGIRYSFILILDGSYIKKSNKLI